MEVSHNGASEYYDGNQIGRYGRVHGSGKRVFVWYHCGLRGNDEPAWAMDTDVEWRVSVSVDTFLVVDDECGLYSIDRDAFTDEAIDIDGTEQYLATASDDFVTHLGDPNDHLRGKLWIESGNQVDEGYHKRANEA